MSQAVTPKMFEQIVSLKGDTYTLFKAARLNQVRDSTMGTLLIIVLMI